MMHCSFHFFISFTCCRSRTTSLLTSLRDTSFLIVRTRVAYCSAQERPVRPQPVPSLVVQHRQCWAHHPHAPCGSCAGRGITCLLWLHACFHRTNGGHDPISVRHAESRASTCRNTRVAMDMPPAGNVKAHLQRGLRLVQVGVGGRHVDKHERLGGAAQAVAHQHRQLVVAVWYVRLRRRDSQLSAARVTIYAFVLMRRHRQAGTAAASCLVATAPTGVPDSDRRRKALSAQQRAMCLALIQIIIKR